MKLTNMNSKQMECSLEGDSVVIDKCLKISFRRAVRVPDNGQASFLPPDLGAFPLTPVSKYAQKLKPEMAVKGGLFFPMYRKSHHVPFLCS